MDGACHSVFISHSSDDNTFVDRLAGSLRAAGIFVWVDETAIGAGDDIISRIEDGLGKATDVVIVLSPQSIKSSWVKEEIHAAQWRAIRGKARLIPLLCGYLRTADIPLLLQSRLYVDFRTRFHLLLVSLLAVLGISMDVARPVGFCGFEGRPRRALRQVDLTRRGRPDS